MDSDDLRASISAAEQEVVNSTSSLKVKHRRELPWKVIVVALILFFIADRMLHHKSGSSREDDLNHMMQQARHTVVDYQHRYNKLPPVVPNAALRPYVTLVKLGDERFRLQGKLGDVTQVMEGP